MIKEKEFKIAQYIESALKTDAPKDTWNLTNNGIRAVQQSLKWVVLVGGEPADYAIKLNEEGKHKGWVNKTIERCMPTIKNILSDNITNEEMEDLLEQENNKLQDKLQKHIERKERELNDIRTSV